MSRKVFVSGTNPATMAYFGWQDRGTALWGLKEGYKNAADDLVDIALSKADNKTLDTYIFPILYLYRHSLEISLKLIYHRFTGEILSDEHRLDKLWERTYHDVIAEINQEDFLHQLRQHKAGFVPWSMEDISFDELSGVFDELQQVDRKSDVWRYLMDKQGSLFFTESQQIDYVTLKATLGDVHNKLEYLYQMVSEYLSS